MILNDKQIKKLVEKECHLLQGEKFLHLEELREEKKSLYHQS